MRHFVIEGGQIVNVIDADPGFTMAGKTLVEADGIDGGIGWSWDGSVATPPAEPAPTGDAVNAERARRIAAGAIFSITGHATPVRLEGDDQTQTNLSGAVKVAMLRDAAGSTDTTTWRDADNVDHVLTPLQMIELFTKSAGWIDGNYNASWVLKALDPIPADYTDDSHWP